MRKYRHHFTLKNAIFLIGAFGLLVAGIIILWISSFQTPNLKSFEERKVIQSTKIYDRTGTVLLYNVHENVKRTVVPLNEISRNLKNATVAIEDAEFYQHHGIRIKSIFRAVLADLTPGGLTQGGSTITQQVVKNSILTTEKKLSRKIKEWVLAIRLEQTFDKETILSYYLNETPYGGSIYGVEEASETFFGKKSSDVTIAEAAYIASLAQAPTFYSPYGNNMDRLVARKNLVLSKMRENNFINDLEYKNALAEKVEFKPRESGNIKAPHFVFYIKEYLVSKYGEKMVEDGGLKVITTLDYKLEEKAEEIVKKYALKNKVDFNAENASIVAVDPKTGQILVMAGSRDYFDKEIDGNFNIAIAHRQPGSAFKPFVYATAFKKGYLPETVLFDVQTEFSTFCNPNGTPITPSNENRCYRPENYDHIYRGPISLRNALAQSINVPAIKVLYLAGLKDSLETAKSMGIESLGSVGQYGLTLVLGGGEVSLLDMTSAYGVFANEGDRNPYQGILRVEDMKGNVLESFEQKTTNVLPKEVALQISDVLSDNEARTPAFGQNSFLYFPGKDVAVKTGTTNDYRDAWIVGYTPNIAIGAWAGNNDNRPMEKKVAGFIIAPLWNAFVNEALSSFPDTRFEEPADIDTSSYPPVLRGFWQGNQSYMVDKTTGNPADVTTLPQNLEERVMNNNIHSILYWIDKKNPLIPRSDSPDNDPQFRLWEYAVQKWVAEQNIPQANNVVIPPNGAVNQIIQSGFTLNIMTPLTGITYGSGTKIDITLSVGGQHSLSRVDFYINNKLIGSSSGSPFSLSFIPKDIVSIKAENTLKVMGTDTLGNKAGAERTFRVSF